jgi:type II secretory pathway predicted ATPase ExeA
VYTEFYQLHEKPFDLTPSARFLYLGEVHREALALLTYGVVERKGFTLLTGEVGTGKTTMVQALLRNLRPHDHCIHLSNPLLSLQDFMNYLAYAAFGQRAHYTSKVDFLIDFDLFLKKSSQDQRNVLLVIDEAQAISYDLLEEIRLLSNLETADQKLIHIFLVGQPELNEKLADFRCRALEQRIAIRYHIHPLSLEETVKYVETRLQVSGAPSAGAIFPKEAIRALHECSGGYPRRINTLADNALLLGYSRGVKKISPQMIRECRGESPREPASEGTPPIRHGPATANVEEKRPNRWRWAVALFLLLLAAAYGFGVSGHIPYLPSVFHRIEPSEREGRGEIRGEIPVSLPVAREADFQAVVTEFPPMEIPLERPAAEVASESGVEETPLEPPPWEATEVFQETGGPPPVQRVVVKRGDTLSNLAINVYGEVNESILEFLKKENPHVTNTNLIEVGNTLLFPPLSR